ncbi:MAG: hypothetical protein IIZ99_00060 [Turicibacter sp.]|nr:hypothetical protein [Turicibacter sp.]
MERKMTIADFSALVGTTSKTIYGKINNYGNLPVNEKLRTVKEKVKGREVTLIITNDDQIEYYKNLYGKEPVINGEYYETVTDINGNIPVNEIQEPVKVNNSKELLSEMFDKLNTVHNEYNERLQKVNDELITYKSKTLLLEDKAGREGYYLNEINELKKVNDRNKLYINVLITVITILLLFITGFITYNYASNKTPEAASTEQVKVDTVETPGVEVSKPGPKLQPKPVKARRK